MRILFLLCFISSSLSLLAQDKYQMKGNSPFTEIDILSSYYEQDGDNAAVTGGIGTEALTDVSSMVIINVPIDSSRSVNFTGGADYYTSASTDNIDNNRSSASSKDVRSYVNLSYTQKNLNRGETYGVRLGFSTEYDYVSINGGINLAKEFNQGNTELSFSAQAFIDQWETYYPRELRGKVSVPTTSRNSYNATISFSQVLSKRLQIGFTAEAIYMDGLLSTPFHRVYFEDQELPDIERLPSTRLKIPFSVRVNYFPFERILLRTYYRYYTDDFGIQAHTVNAEIPIKISDSFTISPFYRYHSQSAADYFAPYQTHLSSSTYYSSDYDLSELSSDKFGLGISYSPLYGVGRAKIPFSKKQLLLNEISLRGSIYNRDTGLNAFSVALNVNFRI